MNIEFKITLWALACAYALGNSFIYSWTFWTAFNINILQFASITDIIPSIIYNLILPFAFIVSSLIFAEIWVRLQESIGKIMDLYLPPYLKNLNKIKRYAFLSTPAICLMMILIAVTYRYKTVNEHTLRDGFSLVAMVKLIIFILTSLFISHFIFFKTTFLSNFRYKLMVILSICFAPTASYYWAVMNSNKIIEGKDTFIVKSDTQCKSSSDNQLRYISSISDKAFALSLKDGSVCIFKYNTLELIPESKKHFTVAVNSKAI